jgi:hypothetical protein
VLEYLLNSPDIDVNLKNNAGLTALDFAIINNNILKVKVLVEKGATIHSDTSITEATNEKIKELFPKNGGSPVHMSQSKNAQKTKNKIPKYLYNKTIMKKHRKHLKNNTIKKNIY